MTSLFGADAPDSDWARIVAVQDRRAGLRAIIVLHSLARGPAFGGVRRLAYASEAAALADAKRLAHAMSLKCAISGLAAGGGKTVILDHPGLADQAAREAAYAALGRAIDELGGRYVCGPDVGTGAAELEVLRRHTRWVNPADNDAGASTAAGVLAGLRGLSRAEFGDGQIAARRYVIQGLGAVGLALAAELRQAGAWVGGWDPDARACVRAAVLGVELLNAETIERTPCDVFMPCALGQTLTAKLCAEAPWRAVCGSANNQLVDDEAAAILHARGIAWAPDFVINAGAVIEGVFTVTEPGPDARARAWANIEAIADRCEALLLRARAEDRPTMAVARAAAEAALAG